MDSTVILWLLSSGRAIRHLKGHSHSVYSVNFNPNGELLASGSDDCTVRLWNGQTGEFIALLTELPGPIQKLRFNHDTTQIAIEDAGDITVVPLTNQQPALKQGHTHVIETVCFSPDGCWLATSG